MKNLAPKSGFILSDSPAVQSGKLQKPVIKHKATATYTEKQVVDTVTLAISAAKRSANVIQKALALTVLHAQATGDIRQIGRLINGIGSVIRMQGPLGFLEAFAPATIEPKGKGYTVTFNADKRWDDKEFAAGGLVEQVLTTSYLEYQPDTPETPFNADKAIISAAVKIANRINEPKAGDLLDIEHCRKMLELAHPLAEEKQANTIKLALDNLAADEAAIDALEGELIAEQEPAALPVSLPAAAAS